MKTLLLIIIVISALSLTIYNAIAGNLPAQQILEHIDQIRAPSDNFTFHIHVRAHTRKGVTENEFDVRVREGKKSLVLYRKPADQVGRALLLDGDNMWIFIPGTSRALRISPQQRLVGAVSNADVARISFHLDYEPEDDVISEKLESEAVLKLRLVAKHKSATYRKIELWFTRDQYHPVRADFFSLSGKLLRTVEYQGYQMVLGKMRPMVLKITDALQPTNQAILTYSKFQIKETPVEFFQPAYLNRLSW